MKETKKERNYVTVFSDYGLDERQRSKSENIGFRCFRELYIVSLIMTVVWYVISCVVDTAIPIVIVAGSYFAAAISATASTLSVLRKRALSTGSRLFHSQREVLQRRYSRLCLLLFSVWVQVILFQLRIK